MNTLVVRNVHQALPTALKILNENGVKRDSRNGRVTMMPVPMTTVYERPEERVMFWSQRDANPFFHFFEALWMLGGKHDVESVARFTNRISMYSDDGKIFNAAYGYRWRVGKLAGGEWGGGLVHDQLTIIANRLKANPDDRRCILQMWEAPNDLDNPSKDVPCNTMATFQVDHVGRLCMCVFNRSNDIIWGCYGANAVHFSMLLEYVARRAGFPVGTYTQISVNWHGYDDTFLPLLEKFSKGFEEVCPYEAGQVVPYPLAQDGCDFEQWDASNLKLLRGKGRAVISGTWADPFFPDVALPLIQAHDAYKDNHGERKYEGALEYLAKCQAWDWRTACSEWIYRRYAKYRKAADDGPETVG